jgi:SAM-dependent methyltransferase
MLTKTFQPDAPAGPNAEQIRYWNEVAGVTWAALEPKITAQLRPLGEEAMARAAIAAGERVLDVGCGGGDTTRALARRVGPAGSVTGVDISEALLSVAARVTGEAGLQNVRFLLADAQTASLPEAAFDLVFSRFGVMFFADPVAAFRNLWGALVPGGRFVFACWRAPQENAWMTVPLAAAAKHVPVQPAEPHAPGPCALADADRTRRLLTEAGFASVEMEPFDHPMSLGGAASLEEAVDFLLEVGPAARALRMAGEQFREAVRGSLREAVAPHVREDGISLGGAIWIVTARKG